MLEQGFGTSDWRVLARVKAQGPNAEKSYPREADFLIIIPQHGLFCLEVKGDSYNIQDGEWYREHPADRSQVGKAEPEPPDIQSEKAMEAIGHGLRQAARGRDMPFLQQIRNIPMWYGVAFTAEQAVTDYDWRDGCLFLRPDDALDRNLLPERIRDHVSKTKPRPAGAHHRAARQLSGPLSDETVDFILRATRRKADSETVLTTGPELAQVNQKLIELTNEQAVNLQMVENEDGNIVHDRVLFTGAAGTGKTMLALELARRRHAAGDRVAVICHTEVLGHWLRKQSPELAPAVGTLEQALIGWIDDPTPEFLSYQKAVADLKPPSADASPAAMTLDEIKEAHLSAGVRVEEIRNDYLLEAMENIDQNDDNRFDYVIVDELQYFDDPFEWWALVLQRRVKEEGRKHRDGE